MGERGVSAVVGITLLLGVTVAGAATLFAVAPSAPTPVPTAALELSADAATDRIALTHRGGETLDAATLYLTVRVDGDPLAHQPPVPFFAARGFTSGPTGPFNVASDGSWRAGTTAAFRLASTNSPGIDPGDSVVVVVRTEAGVIARLETTA